MCLYDWNHTRQVIVLEVIEYASQLGSGLPDLLHQPHIYELLVCFLPLLAACVHAAVSLTLCSSIPGHAKVEAHMDTAWYSSTEGGSRFAWGLE